MGFWQALLETPQWQNVVDKWQVVVDMWQALWESFTTYMQPSFRALMESWPAAWHSIQYLFLFGWIWM